MQKLIARIRLVLDLIAILNKPLLNNPLAAQLINHLLHHSTENNINILDTIDTLDIIDILLKQNGGYLLEDPISFALKTANRYRKQGDYAKATAIYLHLLQHYPFSDDMLNNVKTYMAEMILTKDITFPITLPAAIQTAISDFESLQCAVTGYQFVLNNDHPNAVAIKNSFDAILTESWHDAANNCWTFKALHVLQWFYSNANNIVVPQIPFQLAWEQTQREQIAKLAAKTYSNAKLQSTATTSSAPSFWVASSGLQPSINALTPAAQVTKPNP